MAVQFDCGAECGIIIGAAGSNHYNAPTGTIAIGSSINPLGPGTKSFDFNATATTLFHVRTLAQNIFAGRFYFQWSGFSSGNLTFFRALNASGDSIDIRISSTGQVFLSINGNAAVNIGSPVVVGQTHYVDFVLNASALAATLKGNLDGENEATNSGTLVATGITAIRIGIINSTTARWFMDDFIHGDALTDYPFGPGYVTGFVPTATGTHNQTAGDLKSQVPANITNGDGTWANVDEQPANTTDFTAQVVIRTTTYAEYIYGGTAVINEVPRAVEQVIAVAGGVANTEKAQLFDGTTAADAYALAATAVAVTNRTKQWVTSPSGGAWTPALFKALRIRWGFSNDVTPNPQLTSTIIEAEFRSPIPPVPPYQQILAQ